MHAQPSIPCRNYALSDVIIKLLLITVLYCIRQFKMIFIDPFRTPANEAVLLFFSNYPEIVQPFES